MNSGCNEIVLYMKANSHKHFSNKECKYYPCHDIKDINCLFCYCPLYSRMDCGGKYVMLGNIKDCSNCTIPHEDGGWEYINRRLNETL